MMPALIMRTIEYDMYCIGCEYNLRTLSFAGRCPECGSMVIHSATTFVEAVMAGECDPSTRDVRREIDAAAPVLDQPAEALQFVYDSLLYATRCMMRPARFPAAERPPISATHLCLALRDYAILQFGREARARMEKLKIHGSNDIGRLVTGLMRAGQLAQAGDEGVEAFNGLFTLDQLFAASARV